MQNKKGQNTSLVGVIIGGVMALIISVIIIYAVGFPVLSSINQTGYNTSGALVPLSQQTNFGTVLTLLGVTAIIVALVVFMMISRMAA